MYSKLTPPALVTAPIDVQLDVNAVLFFVPPTTKTKSCACDVENVGAGGFIVPPEAAGREALLSHGELIFAQPFTPNAIMAASSIDPLSVTVITLEDKAA